MIFALFSILGARAPDELGSVCKIQYNPGWTGDVGCFEAVPDTFSIGWNLQGDYIEFVLERQGSGWMSIGINEYGGMPGADFIVVSPNKVEDRFAAWEDGWYVLPRLDSVQNVELLDYKSVDGRTAAKVRRPLISCDEEDYSIVTVNDKLVSGALIGGYPHWILWALGETSDIQYHGAVRGSLQVNFYKDWTFIGPNLVPEADEIATPVVFDNYALSTTKENTFVCQVVELPASMWDDAEYGVSLYREEPHVSEFLHHILTLGCMNNPDPQGRNIFECEMPPFAGCGGAVFVFGYAGGMPGQQAPAGQGFTFESHHRYLVQQSHFYNPTLKDATDSSGATYYFTKTNRPQAINTMYMGPAYYSFQKEDGPETHTAATVCDCGNFPQKPIIVTAVFHHMHYMGQRMETYVVRGENRINILLSRQYDVSHQQLIPVRFKMLPGDKVATKCWYDLDGYGWKKAGSPQRVDYGLGTDEEMCYVFLQYVNEDPEEPSSFFRCFSNPKVNPGGMYCNLNEQEFMVGPTEHDPYWLPVVAGDWNPYYDQCLLSEGGPAPGAQEDVLEETNHVHPASHAPWAAHCMMAIILSALW